MNEQDNRDWSRETASDDDNVRDAVTWQDSTTYSMALPQVYARFVEAGLDRSLRTLQRYCEQGHLRAAKYPTETGAVWYVDPASVETKIEEIRQVQETLHRPATLSYGTHRPPIDDMSQHDADRRQSSPFEGKADSHDTPTATHDDEPRQENHDAARRADGVADDTPDVRGRQAATGHDAEYVTVPVVMLDALTAQLAAKDEQIKRQDAQMDRLVESHDKDRQLLGAALAIIHKNDFPMELREGGKLDWDSAPEQADEIKPDFGQGGGNRQSDHPTVGV